MRRMEGDSAVEKGDERSQHCSRFFMDFLSFSGDFPDDTSASAGGYETEAVQERSPYDNVKISGHYYKKEKG